MFVPIQLVLIFIIYLYNNWFVSARPMHMKQLENAKKIPKDRVPPEEAENNNSNRKLEMKPSIKSQSFEENSGAITTERKMNTCIKNSHSKAKKPVIIPVDHDSRNDANNSLNSGEKILLAKMTSIEQEVVSKLTQIEQKIVLKLTQIEQEIVPKLTQIEQEIVTKSLMRVWLYQIARQIAIMGP